MPISDPTLRARNPASSPDGTSVAFMVTRPDGTGTDLYIADSDGGHARRLLEHAMNEGWSADGRFVLTRWIPPHGNGGLSIVTPDGQLTVVAPPDEACPIDVRLVCDLGWGVPRP